MVAFLAAFTSLLGEGPLFFRLGPVLCSAVALMLLRYLALGLYGDERVALGSVILLFLMPYQHLLTVALLPDATLNLFWCGTLLALWYAMTNGKWSAWVLAGVLFGGALLSKYHAVLMPLCLFGYVVSSRTRRFWLKKPQPYVAGSIGIFIFLPNIVWNARHEWVSYAFQLAHGGSGRFSIEKLLGVLGGQMGAWSPLVFGLLIAAFISLIRKDSRHEPDRFVIWTSLPVFLFFCGMGTFGKILPHWPSVGWWSGSLAIVSVILRKVSLGGQVAVRWRGWCIAAAVTGFAITLFMYLALFFPIVGPLYDQARNISLKLNQKFPVVKPLGPFKNTHDITNTLFGWEEIAKEVETIRGKMPHPDRTFIFCHRFLMTSRLAVYLDAETEATILRSKFSQYHLWFSPEGHVGWDALFVVDDRARERSQRYLPLFREIDSEPVPIRVFRKGRLAHALTVYRYFGFEGRFEER
jgi:4-amino-4-deoxy-L-arabinose transferase-like glycosyltransferase